jgi:hypothetical protein
MKTLELKLALKFTGDEEVNPKAEIENLRQVIAETYRNRGDVEVSLVMYEDAIE